MRQLLAYPRRRVQSVSIRISEEDFEATVLGAVIIIMATFVNFLAAVALSASLDLTLGKTFLLAMLLWPVLGLLGFFVGRALRAIQDR